MYVSQRKEKKEVCSRTGHQVICCFARKRKRTRAWLNQKSCRKVIAGQTLSERSPARVVPSFSSYFHGKVTLVFLEWIYWNVPVFFTVPELNSCLLLLSVWYWLSVDSFINILCLVPFYCLMKLALWLTVENWHFDAGAEPKTSHGWC